MTFDREVDKLETICTDLGLNLNYRLEEIREATTLRTKTRGKTREVGDLSYVGRNERRKLTS